MGVRILYFISKRSVFIYLVGFWVTTYETYHVKYFLMSFLNNNALALFKSLTINRNLFQGLISNCQSFGKSVFQPLEMGSHSNKKRNPKPKAKANAFDFAEVQV